MPHVQVTGIQISHRFPKHIAEKHFGDYHLMFHVSTNAKVATFGDTSVKIFNLH